MDNDDKIEALTETNKQLRIRVYKLLALVIRSATDLTDAEDVAKILDDMANELED